MDMKSLDEVDSYALLKEGDDILLFDKDLNKEVWRTSKYRNISCGILGLTNDWAVFGGDCLVVWNEGQLHEINNFEIKRIYNLRQIGDNEIEVLTDSWSKNLAKWSFNIKTFERVWIRNMNSQTMMKNL